MIRRPLLIALLSCLALAASGAGQTVYFVEDDGTGPAVRAMAATGPVTYYVPPPPFSQITALAADDQGRLFLALHDGAGTSELHRIDAGGAPVPILTGLGIAVSALDAGLDGRVYFGEQFTNVVRVDSGGADFTTLHSGTSSAIDHVTTDLLGAVYYVETNFFFDPPELRIIAAGGASFYESYAVGGIPVVGELGGVHFGPCGRLYFDESGGGSSTLYRVDPTGPTAVFSVASPASIAPSHATTAQGAQLVLVENEMTALGSQDRIISVTAMATTTVYQAPPSATIVHLVVVPEPCTAPNHVTGSVGASAGGPYDVANVNGSAGGATREVFVSPQSTFSFGVLQPPSASGPQAFALLARIGRCTPGEVVEGPPEIGSLACTPCLSDPSNPLLVTLADGFGLPCPALFVGTTTPWTLTVLGGLPPAFGSWWDITVQALVQDSTSASGLATSNAVVLRITDDL